MDNTLLNDYIERIIFLLFPKMQKEVELDEETGAFLRDVVILKMDPGPGRIVGDGSIISHTTRKD